MALKSQNMIYLLRLISVCLFFSLWLKPATGQPQKLYPILNDEVKYLYKEFKNIEQDRRYYLDRIVKQLKFNILSGKETEVILIDYSNGAISQMAQAWCSAAAYYYGHPEISFYSGGIENKEIDTRTIQTLEYFGFIIYKNMVEEKPVYEVHYSYGLKPIYLFPKKYLHRYNPPENFMAITLQEAAEMNLPIIKGALNREGILYQDPVGYLDSDMEMEKYQEISRKIALEMFYIFSQLKHVKRNG